MKTKPSAKTEITFPYTVEVRGFPGITAKIYRSTQTKRTKGGPTNYTNYTVAYTLLGKRKLETRASFEEAKQAGKAAIARIAEGEQQVLQLKNAERFAYLRAIEVLSPINKPLESACIEYADAIIRLSGRATLTEAVADYLKRHHVPLPKITVEQAVDEMIAQAEADKKGKHRIRQLKEKLYPLKLKFRCQLLNITPKEISDHIISGNVTERTKKNTRDVLVAFFRWCVLRGYLPKDNDLMANVQRYRNKKVGNISIYTPEELENLLAAAKEDMLPFVAIGAFAGLRTCELGRLDWRDVDLEDGWIHIQDATAKQTDDGDGLRRLVPIRENLKSWLSPLAKDSGRVCRFENIAKQLGWLSADAGVEWKRNALRHSYISYAVAESGDIARIADQSGNSPQIIRKHYLKRVKPKEAAVWFGNIPPRGILDPKKTPEASERQAAAEKDIVPKMAA